MRSLQFIYLVILLLRSALLDAIYSLKWRKKGDSSLVNYIWYLGHKLDIFGLDNLKHFIWNDTLHCNFGRQLGWGTERPGVLQSTGSRRIGHDWATEQQPYTIYFFCFWPQDFNTKYHPSAGCIINLSTSASINQCSIQFTSFKKNHSLLARSSKQVEKLETVDAQQCISQYTTNAPTNFKWWAYEFPNEVFYFWYWCVCLCSCSRPFIDKNYQKAPRGLLWIRCLGFVTSGISPSDLWPSYDQSLY